MSDKHLPTELIQRLPRYRTATHIPQRFEDSTHELWRLEGIGNTKDASKNNFLKICNNTTSPFWQVMQYLFDFSLATEINKFDQLYSFINASTSLQIPRVITAESSSQAAYILTSELSGNVVSPNHANQQMVEQLALHLAELHQRKYDYWGSITAHNSQHKEAFGKKQWQEKLAQTLRHFSKLQDVPEKYATQALAACQYARTSKFVPLMLDLRWDQFLQQDGELKALVDLDAFILAPHELDFVLVEYILTADQHNHFAKTYCKTATEEPSPIPDIEKVRPAYRLLLFFMQVLGEQDIDVWMTVKAQSKYN